MKIDCKMVDVSRQSSNTSVQSNRLCKQSSMSLDDIDCSALYLEVKYRIPDIMVELAGRELKYLIIEFWRQTRFKQLAFDSPTGNVVHNFGLQYRPVLFIPSNN